MTDIKKEQEREELHRAIWAIADELRGAVDGWDFKNYVLGTMFYRFISEDLTNYINQNEIEAGDADFDYAKMSDEDAEEAREGLIEENQDVIFVVYFSDYQKDIIRSIFQQPEYSSLKAVQNNRICLLPFDCMYTSAIKTIKGIRLIKNGLYPELNASGKRS